MFNAMETLGGRFTKEYCPLINKWFFTLFFHL